MGQISPETRAFLSAVDAEGGAADTRQIRHRTQLTEGKLQYQFRKLSKTDPPFIDIDYREKGSNSNAPIKVAHLTDAARIAIKDGLLDADCLDPVEVDVVALAERVAALEAQLATLGSESDSEGSGNANESEQVSHETTSEKEESAVYARRAGLL